jgi:hypothetical protein
VVLAIRVEPDRRFGNDPNNFYAPRVKGVTKLRIRLFAMSLALTFAGGLALAAEPEPQPQIPAGSSEATKCYRLLAEAGLEVPVGQAIELCAGTVAAAKTFACFLESWGPPSNNGLGLPLGLAVDLCRTIPRDDP